MMIEQLYKKYWGGPHGQWWSKVSSLQETSYYYHLRFLVYKKPPIIIIQGQFCFNHLSTFFKCRHNDILYKI